MPYKKGSSESPGCPQHPHAHHGPPAAGRARGAPTQGTGASPAKLTNHHLTCTTELSFYIN